MSLVSYYLQGAKESQWDFALWVRYLNKSIRRYKNGLIETDVAEIIDSGQLEKWQEAILKMAMKKKSVMWQWVVGYSEPADTVRYREFVEDMREKGMLDNVSTSSRKTKDIDVKVIIFNESTNSVLLLQTSENNGNHWLITGGAVANDESGKIAAVRMIKEEFDIDINDDELAHVFSTQNGSKETYAYFWESNLSETAELSGAVDTSSEYSAKWVKLADLKKINLQPELLKKRLVHYFEVD